ncbi:pickpocket protein 28-like [Lucilia sericata]|uniref:pickpocket protein 28-like n=1 Tax=Lucilia sericata TaxID=13632 RepID=UPI0018A7FBE3|nr:pickpocket protein 28-like [Lucilia sericata]
MANLTGNDGYESSNFIYNNEPFPAITICNMNQAQYSKVKNFDVQSLNYAMLQKLCFQELNYSSFAHTKPFPKGNSFSRFIVKNGQPCEHMVVYCIYGNTKRVCTDLFREVLLDEGLCCSFNMVHPFMLYKGEYYMIQDYTSFNGQTIPLDWSPGKGYPKELPNSYYPRASLGEGMSNGLTIVLNGDIDNYYCSSTNGPGFKVSFHNPIDTPHVKETGLSIALGYQTNFRVTSLKEEAVEGLRTSSKPKERQCYYSDEYPLYYFRYYTRRNCEMECDAFYMLEECNCIPYHMPKLWQNVTECNVRHFNCVVEAEKDFVDPKRLKCKRNCLASCNDLSYFPKAFFTPLDNEGFQVRSPFFRNMSKESLNNNFAMLKIFFPQNYYRGNIKTPYMGLTEFLSQTGGIMGLMMGFSIISLVEMTNSKYRYPVAPPNVLSGTKLPPYTQHFEHPNYVP